MPRTLDRLPFDVLFCIASSLTFDDIVSLSLTCRQLRLLLNEGTLCRRTIETHVPHSKEAKLAQREKITYREAVQRIYERREAFAKASPFSASILGHGSAFMYRQGILCYLSGSSIRVLEVHSPLSGPRTIGLSPIISSVAIAGISDGKITLLYYSDDILALHYERKARPSDSWLLAVSTKADTPDAERLVAKIELESSSKLFARHTASFLYYGTHSGVGTHGHHEWRIHGVALDAEHAIPPGTPPLQLEDFVGSDMGSTVAFEIHDGHFYALSNQTSFDVEEVDWTSFYHVVRFPLERPSRNALKTNSRIYRRQHAEGPINDSWTDLSLQVDEFTNALVIVESRREWLEGGSKQTRIFYTQDIVFPEELSSSQSSSPAVGPSTGPALPLDDPFVALLASDNNAHWAPSQPRYERYTHPEYGLKDDPARSFILARTKLRAYNLTCSTFLDLVEDEKCCANPCSPAPCLRLRIGSRRLAPADESDDTSTPTAATKGKQPLKYESLPPKSGADDRFRYSPIAMWPPPAHTCRCAARLHGILNPPLPSGSAYGKSLIGVVDERSLVYMLRPARSYGEDNPMGPIVLVSFDRAIGRVRTEDAGEDNIVESGMGDCSGESEMRSRWEAGKAEACLTGTCC